MAYTRTHTHTHTHSVTVSTHYLAEFTNHTVTGVQHALIDIYATHDAHANRRMQMWAIAAVE